MHRKDISPSNYIFFIFTSNSRIAQRMDFLSLGDRAGNSRSVNMVAVFGSGGRSIWPEDCTHTRLAWMNGCPCFLKHRLGVVLKGCGVKCLAQNSSSAGQFPAIPPHRRAVEERNLGVGSLRATGHCFPFWCALCGLHYCPFGLFTFVVVKRRC